jgi:hypothetical protein
LRKIIIPLAVILWLLVGLFSYVLWTERNMPWPIYLVATGVLCSILLSRIRAYLPIWLLLLLLVFMVGYSSYKFTPMHSLSWSEADSVKVVQYNQAGRRFEWITTDSEAISLLKEYGRKGSFVMDCPRGVAQYYEIHTKNQGWRTFEFFGNESREMKRTPCAEVYFKTSSTNFYNKLQSRLDTIMVHLFPSVR